MTDYNERALRTGPTYEPPDDETVFTFVDDILYEWENAMLDYDTIDEVAGIIHLIGLLNKRLKEIENG